MPRSKQYGIRIYLRDGSTRVLGPFGSRTEAMDNRPSGATVISSRVFRFQEDVSGPPRVIGEKKTGTRPETFTVIGVNAPGDPGEIRMTGTGFSTLARWVVYYDGGAETVEFTAPYDTDTNVQVVETSEELEGQTVTQVDLYDGEDALQLSVTGLSVFIPGQAAVITNLAADNYELVISGTNLLTATSWDLVACVHPDENEAWSVPDSDPSIVSASDTEVRIDMQQHFGSHDDPLIRQVTAQPSGDVETLSPPNFLSFDNGQLTASIAGNYIRLVNSDWRNWKVVQCVLHFDDSSDSGLLTKGVSPFSDWDDFYWGIEKAAYEGKTLEAVEVWRNRSGDPGNDTTEGLMPLDTPLSIPGVVPTITSHSSPANDNFQINGTDLDLVDRLDETGFGAVGPYFDPNGPNAGSNPGTATINVWSDTLIDITDTAAGGEQIYSWNAQGVGGTPDYGVLGPYSVVAIQDTVAPNIVSAGPGTFDGSVLFQGTDFDLVDQIDVNANGGPRFYDPNGPQAGSNPESANIIQWDDNNIEILDYILLNGGGVNDAQLWGPNGSPDYGIFDFPNFNINPETLPTVGSFSSPEEDGLLLSGGTNLGDVVRLRIYWDNDNQNTFIDPLYTEQDGNHIKIGTGYGMGLAGETVSRVDLYIGPFPGSQAVIYSGLSVPIQAGALLGYTLLGNGFSSNRGGNDITKDTTGRIVLAADSDDGSATIASGSVRLEGDDGAPDTNWGGDGFIQDQLSTAGGVDEQTAAVAVSGSGGVFTMVNKYNEQEVIVVKRNDGGLLESDFDGDGKLLANGPGSAVMHGLAVENGNGYIVVGTNSNFTDGVIDRYDEITGAAVDGYQFTAGTALLAMQQVAAGQYLCALQTGANHYLSLVDIDLQTENTVQQTEVNPAGSWGSYALAKSGSSYYLGGKNPNTNNIARIAKYDSSFVLDTSFAGVGYYDVSVPNNADGSFEEVIVLPGGDVVACGWYGDNTAYGWLFARFDANGNPVTSFGNNGVLQVNPGSTDAMVYGAILDPDDTSRILATGYTNPGEAETVVARILTADGSLDPTFGDA